MSANPYRDNSITPDVSADRPMSMSNVWLPLAIIAALIVGGIYYFAGGSSTTPAVKADSGVTQSPPSPN